MTLQQQADVAFLVEKNKNMNFWTMSIDDPEVVYWKQIWLKGYEVGYLAAQNEAAKEIEKNYIPNR